MCVCVCVGVCGCVCVCVGVSVCPPFQPLNQLIDFHEIMNITPADVTSVPNSENSSNY